MWNWASHLSHKYFFSPVGWTLLLWVVNLCCMSKLISHFLHWKGWYLKWSTLIWVFKPSMDLNGRLQREQRCSLFSFFWACFPLKCKAADLLLLCTSLQTEHWTPSSWWKLGKWSCLRYDRLKCVSPAIIPKSVKIFGLCHVFNRLL